MTKNVLVTGADGFIGSHLTEMLAAQGNVNVRALVQYNSFNSWGWLEQNPFLNDLDVRTGDIRDPYFCRKLTEDIDTVFHLAALIAIPYSYLAPESYVETNVKGTLNICQAALDNDVQRVIHTSTSEVYGSALYVPIDESHPLQPQSPYSASKIGADMMAMSFFHSFGLKVSIARPFNTYGPRQSARAVIPTVISQIASGEKTLQIGDLSPTRDFNYVLDTCRGFLALEATETTVGQTVNIGSNFEISIGDTLKTIARLMDAEVNVVQDPQRIRPAGSEVQRLWCDNKKIHDLTGFEPEFNIEQGLSETIKWFTDRDNLKHYKTNIYNV